METTTERQVMCGIGVVTKQLAGCKGYVLELDNDTDQALAVDFDFTGSDNLHIQPLTMDGCSHEGMIATIKIPPAAEYGETKYLIELEQTNSSQGIALNISAAPAADAVLTTLECGVDMTTMSLPGCKGYDITFTNPQEEDMTLEFDFSKSENLSTLPKGITQVAGMSATVSVPAGAKEFPFVQLETINVTLPIAMEYNLASYPTKEADPEAKRDILKCGAALTLQPLPKAGGYEFSFDNPTEKKHVLRFDFAKSDNLALEAMDSALHVEVKEQCATVTLTPAAELTKAFLLMSVDKTKGVQMNYALSSQTEEGNMDAASAPPVAE